MTRLPVALLARPGCTLLAFAALGACSPRTTELGDWTLTFNDDGAIDVDHLGQPHLEGAHFSLGTGDADVQMSFGAFLFEDVQLDVQRSTRLRPISTRTEPAVVDISGPDGRLGTLLAAPGPDGTLLIEIAPDDFEVNRVGFDAPCDDDDHFMGLGSHASDTDHIGEAFPLFVSEPGIGKTDDDVPPDDWFIRGTKHASSFPVPFLLRPHRPQGLLLDTYSRVEVDLCASDQARFSALAWQPGALRIVLVPGEDPLDVVRTLTAYTGRPTLPQPWVFAPWNDAIRGSDRVREVAAALRDAGAPSSVIWTEDWKGAEQTANGYQLTGEWFVDRTLYPDVEAVADELEADGFKWYAYFAPFLEDGTRTWDEAVAAGVVVSDAAGDPYRFKNARFVDAGLLDLSGPGGVGFAHERMQAALDLGFDGWMADFAEWLPLDARVGSGLPAEIAHQAYPEWWQATSASLLQGLDASFFVRSGWIRTGGLAPVVWAGDQRTSFDPDDGLPTILPLGLGLSASGVPVYTHDVAGYQSIGNDPSDKELWLRWASLGAFSPVLRTHHGAFDTDNWQFDSDAETLAHWARMAAEHTRLFPYRYGLAARAAEDGTPMVLPTSFVFPGEEWGRTDAWMLGSALLVAPITERGATSRQVALPAGEWYDWWTLQPATSGEIAVAIDDIAVFAAAGTTVPTFAVTPDTLVSGVAGRVSLDDVDGARRVYLFGGGGTFTEADGTTYASTGAPTASAEATQTLTSGQVEVAGVTVTVTGSVERIYTMVVVE